MKYWLKKITNLVQIEVLNKWNGKAGHLQVLLEESVGDCCLMFRWHTKCSLLVWDGDSEKQQNVHFLKQKRQKLSFSKVDQIHTSFVQELPTLEKVQKTVIFFKKIDKNCTFFKVCQISKNSVEKWKISKVSFEIFNSRKNAKTSDFFQKNSQKLQFSQV